MRTCLAAGSRALGTTISAAARRATAIPFGAIGRCRGRTACLLELSATYVPSARGVFAHRAPTKFEGLFGPAQRFFGPHTGLGPARANPRAGSGSPPPPWRLGPSPPGGARLQRLHGGV